MNEPNPPPARSAAGDNPFFQDWTRPFGAPPFGRIAPEHFGPAFDRAFAAHDSEVAALATNPAPPSFDNTIAALELSGRSWGGGPRVFAATARPPPKPGFAAARPPPPPPPPPPLGRHPPQC